MGAKGMADVKELELRVGDRAEAENGGEGIAK
jgi:hypothetical protein